MFGTQCSTTLVPRTCSRIVVLSDRMTYVFDQMPECCLIRLRNGQMTMNRSLEKKQQLSIRTTRNVEIWMDHWSVKRVCRQRGLHNIVLTAYSRLIGVVFPESSQSEQRSTIVVSGTYAVAGCNQISNVLFLIKVCAAADLFTFYCKKKKFNNNKKKKFKIINYDIKYPNKI